MVPPAEFSCSVLTDRQRVFVLPRGELDMATAPQLDAQLLELAEAGFEHVVLDLQGLSFLDSSGINLLVTWHRRATTGGWRFEITEGREQVMRPIELSGVRDALPFRSGNRHI